MAVYVGDYGFKIMHSEGFWYKTDTCVLGFWYCDFEGCNQTYFCFCCNKVINFSSTTLHICLVNFYSVYL